MLDTDNSGTITFDELKEGLKRVGSELMESEIKDLMDAVRKLSPPSIYSTVVFFVRQVSYLLVFGRQILITAEHLTMVNFLLLHCT